MSCLLWSMIVFWSFLVYHSHDSMRNTGQVFCRKFLNLNLSDFSSHDWNGVTGFKEKHHRGEELLFSHHIKRPIISTWQHWWCYPESQVMLTRSFTVKVLFFSFHNLLFRSESLNPNHTLSSPSWKGEESIYTIGILL